MRLGFTLPLAVESQVFFNYSLRNSTSVQSQRRWVSHLNVPIKYLKKSSKTLLFQIKY